MTKPILSIGFELRSDLVENVTFDSIRSLLEFKIVVVNLTSPLSTIRHGLEMQGPMFLTAQKAKEYSALFTQKLASFDEFVNHDRLLVYLVNKLDYDFQFVSNSGMSAPMGLEQFLPNPLIETVHNSGTIVCESHTAPAALKDFAKIIKNDVNYLATIPENSRGQVIMTIQGTNKAVAQWFPHQSTGILFLPYPKSLEANHKVYAEALHSLYEQLTNENELDALPEWHLQYQLPKEQSLRKCLSQLDAQLAKLREDIEGVTVDLEDTLLLKRIFTDQGDSLVVAVSEALKMLSFSVEPGPNGRDDLVLTDTNERKYVVEVKGRDTRGAAEADAAQLEKWASGFYEANGTEPKSILVVNGHRLTPLRDRQEGTFPDQMLSYAIRKEQCLLSGFQLLALLLAVQQGKKTPGEIQNLINDSKGVFPLYKDVSDCLALLANTSSNKS